MKRYLLPGLLLSLAAALPLLADDGSWADSRGYTPAEGALYAVEGHPDIALEKEYLELSDFRSGATRAVFFFRNTAGKALTVECGFPVRISFYAEPVMVDAAMNQVYKEGPGVRKGWAFGGGGKYSSRHEGPYDLDLAALLAALKVPSAMYSPGEPGFCQFIAEADYPRGRVDFPAKALAGLFHLSIAQDGKTVGAPACVVEFGDRPGLIVVHFRHRLSFAPYAASVVDLGYAYRAGDSAMGGANTAGYDLDYEWSYVLETGASWKGPIGLLALALPPGYRGSLPAPFVLAGVSGGRLLYLARDWDPAKGQDLAISYGEPVIVAGDVRGRWVDEPRELAYSWDGPSTEGLEVLGASSFLADRADIFVRAGVYRGMGFEPERAFDGCPESSWVEGRPDEGLGEYLRFKVKRPMVAAMAITGFLRSTVDLPEKGYWSFFSKNARVRILLIATDDGTPVASLALADSRESQWFSVSLPPGIYRASIGSVYPGSRWKDACLAELFFLTGGTELMALIAGDPFLSAYLAK